MAKPTDGCSRFDKWPGADKRQQPLGCRVWPRFPQAALAEAKAAVALAPNAVQRQMMLGDVLEGMGQPEGARSAYQKALELAKTVEPEFQVRSIPSIEQKLAHK